MVLNIKAGFWLEAEFVESDYSIKEQDGYISKYLIEGFVFFSASPFQIERRTLCIKNSPAPDEVISKLKRAYETNTAEISIDGCKHKHLKFLRCLMMLRRMRLPLYPHLLH